MRTVVAEDGGLVFEALAQGEVKTLAPSHWSFGQIASYARAPASYLRGLPDELAAINLQWGLEHNPIRDNAGGVGTGERRDVCQTLIRK